MGEALLKIFGGLFVLIAGCFFGALCSGYTLSVLWEWFVVSTFGIKQISIAQAYGLCLVAGVMKGVKTGKDSKMDFPESMARIFLGFPFACGLILLLGYIAKGFI